MIVVGSKEFASNQNKYFDMAINERVLVQRGSNMFHLAHTNDNDTAVKERVYYLIFFAYGSKQNVGIRTF